MKSLESEVKKVKEHEEHYMNKVEFDPNENRHEIKWCWKCSWKNIKIDIVFVPGKGVEEQVFEVRAHAS